MIAALRIVSGAAMLVGAPLALTLGHTLAALHLAACALSVGLLTRDLPPLVVVDGGGGAR
jgi:hypothetical protein